MFVIISVILGVLYGAFIAKKKGGTRLDMAQYAGTYAILFGIIGLFLMVAITRLVG